MSEIPLRQVPRSAERRIVRWPGAPPRADPWEDGFWQAQDLPNLDALWTAWEEVERTGDRTDFLEVAQGLELCGPGLHDKNLPAWGIEPCTLDDLVRLTADLWPAVGVEGPEIVLGRCALVASPARLRIAVAGCAFLWAHRRWPTPFIAWCRSKPRPLQSVRQAVRAVGLAPWALWRVEHRGDGVHLHDHTGLGPAYRPSGPVQIVGEVPTGEGLAARVLRGPAGWIAHTALSVPVLPPIERVRRWVGDELILARTFRPELRVEPLLRHRAILVRRVL